MTQHATLISNSRQFLRDMRAPFLLSLGAAITLPWCSLIGYAAIRALVAVTGQTVQSASAQTRISSRRFEKI
jgi:hypothetical protein